MKKTLLILSLAVSSAALAMESAPKEPEAKPGVCASLGAKVDALGAWSVGGVAAGWQYSRTFCVNRASDAKKLGIDAYTWGKAEKTKAALFALSLVGAYRGQRDFRVWRTKQSKRA